MRFDTSMENLIGIGRSESFADLNFAKNIIGSSSNLMSTSGDCRYHYHDDDLFNSKTEEGKKFLSIFHFSPFTSTAGNARNRHSFSGKSSAEENNFTTTSSKPFGMSKLIVPVHLEFSQYYPLLPIGARIKKKQRKRKANEKQRKRSEIHHPRKRKNMKLKGRKCAFPYSLLAFFLFVFYYIYLNFEFSCLSKRVKILRKNPQFN